MPRKKAESVSKVRRRKKATPALDRLSAAELASVLGLLLKRHPELRGEAEAIALELVSIASAEQVQAMMGWYDIDDLNQRSGDHGWGYVSPEEAADEMLAEAIEDHVEEMKRKAQLGFYDAAAVVCEGIVMGLYLAREPVTGSVLSWSPDFPFDAATGAVTDLRRACPAEVRAAVMARLCGVIDEQAPVWAHAITRAASK